MSKNVKRKKMSKTTHLVIDGNLIAKKSFYKFKNLSAKITISNLLDLSKPIAQLEQAKLTFKSENKEIVSEDSGQTMEIINTGKIDAVLHQMAALADVVTIPTGILYGMLRSILVANRKYKINGKTIICYDPVFNPEDNTLPFRKEYFSDYKNRKKDSSEEAIFQEGLLLAQSFFYKAGITQTKTDSFEADDLIHFYTHNELKGDKVLVMTNDHDLFQVLVPNRVSMVRLGMNPELFTSGDLCDKYGLRPTQWSSAQALGGCSTDNVKGVYGISFNTAVKLIKEFGTIKKLLNSDLGELPKRVRTALEKEKAQNYTNLKLSRKLTKLYGLDEFLISSKNVAKSDKSSEKCYNAAIFSLKKLKFNSFLTDKAQKDLISFIGKNTIDEEE